MDTENNGRNLGQYCHKIIKQTLTGFDLLKSSNILQRRENVTEATNLTSNKENAASQNVIDQDRQLFHRIALSKSSTWKWTEINLNVCENTKMAFISYLKFKTNSQNSGCFYNTACKNAVF